MSCKKFKQQQILYLYHELDNGEKKRFEEHITQCANCRKELEILQETRHIYQALPLETVELQPGINVSGVKSTAFVIDWLQHVWEKMRPHSEPRWRYTLAPAGIVVLMLFIFLVINRDHFKQGKINQDLIMNWHSQIDDSLDALHDEVTDLMEQTDYAGNIHATQEDQILALWVSSTDRKLNEIKRDIEYLSREINKSYF